MTTATARKTPELSASTPRVLLIDIMDTVVRDPFFSDDLSALFGVDRDTLLARMTPDLWPAFERDELTEAEYYARFFRDGSGVDGEALKRFMAERYAWLPGMQALLTGLRDAGVPVYALSNYPVWWRLIEARLGLSRVLAWRFVSCMTGVRKPDPAAYTGPAASLGLPVEACLFIDDRGSNCSAAENVGMPAHHFRDAEGLRSDLKARGLPV